MLTEMTSKSSLVVKVMQKDYDEKGNLKKGKDPKNLHITYRVLYWGCLKTYLDFLFQKTNCTEGAFTMALEKLPKEDVVRIIEELDDTECDKLRAYFDLPSATLEP